MSETVSDALRQGVGVQRVFVWGDQPSTRRYSPRVSYSQDRNTVIRRTSVGKYEIEIGEIVVEPGANVQVSVVGTTSELCTVRDWSRGVIRVACFSERGTPADSLYSVLATRAARGASGIAYVWADRETEPSYTAAPIYAAQPASRPVHVRRNGTGSYTVDFEKLPAGGNVQVTAYGNQAVHCAVAHWGGGAASVRCFTATGAAIDSQFSLLYTTEQAAREQAYAWAGGASGGRADLRYAYNSAGSAVTIERTGPGVYSVALGNIVGEGGNGQVTAYGSTGNRCNVGGWGAGRVLIRCFDARGHAADSRFSALFTAGGGAPEQPPAPGLADQLLGKTDCRYGDPACNRCVTDVVAAFNALPSRPTSRIRYTSAGGRRLPPSNTVLAEFAGWTSHVQGIARIAGIPPERWFVLSRSRPGNAGGGGFFLVELGDLDGNGGDAFSVTATEPGANTRTRFYYPMRGTDHPGGLQTIGQILAITASCDERSACGQRTFIDFFNLATPEHARHLQRFELDGSRGEPRQPSHATSVAVTKLLDGTYLMFVHGKDDRAEGWFYRSRSTRIDPFTRWDYLQHWNAENGGVVPAGQFTGRYQNTTFLTQCDSGRVFMVGAGNPDFGAVTISADGPLDVGRGLLHLFVLESPDDKSIRFRAVAGRAFSQSDDGFCSFRAGAMPHVTPSGDLVLYCTAHKANTNIFNDPDSKLKLSEFAP
ncbi:MAG: hypothetical protein OEN22_02090 [Gammaproteobacteria bacterium]|nr:hypothetical protein [Gammaproteobacteria bacterium]